MMNNTTTIKSSSGRALILKRFKEIGLTSNELKSYLTLLERQTLTVPEVSKLAGIPLPNAYRALERLMSKGLCISRPGPTKKYSASDPSLLEDKLLSELNTATQMELEKLRKKEKEILENSEAVKENITNMIRELGPQYEKSRLETNPMDFIEIIKDSYQIHKRFMQLVAQTKVSRLTLVKPPYSSDREGAEEQFAQQVEQLRQGITVRAVYEIPRDKEEIEWWFKTIDTAHRHGEQARVIKELPMKMAIIDERIVMLALTDPISKRNSLTTQIVEHPDLAKGLKVLFETLWEQSEDYHILIEPGR